MNALNGGFLLGLRGRALTVSGRPRQGVQREAMEGARGIANKLSQADAEDPERSGRQLVAVYGSLITGLHNHRYVEKQTLLGQGIITGFEMFAYNGTSPQSGYPAISPVEGEVSSQVVVQTGQRQVYSVNEDGMKVLDWLEEVGEEYDRKVVDVECSDGRKLRAWVYYMSREKASQNGKLSSIPRGDWCTFLKNSQ